MARANDSQKPVAEPKEVGKGSSEKQRAKVMLIGGLGLVAVVFAGKTFLLGGGDATPAESTPTPAAAAAPAGATAGAAGASVTPAAAAASAAVAAAKPAAVQPGPPPNTTRDPFKPLR